MVTVGSAFNIYFFLDALSERFPGSLTYSRRIEIKKEEKWGGCRRTYLLHAGLADRNRCVS
jgi:hypothetical protein